jgi:hypothetical protein
MRTVLMPAVVPLLLALCWAPSSPAADKASDTTPHQSFYRASLSFFSDPDAGAPPAGGDFDVYGYAALQWLGSGDVTGKICVYGPDAAGRKVEYDELGVTGRNSADGKLDLRIDLPAGLPQSRLAAALPRDVVHLTLSKAEPPLLPSGRWTTVSDTPAAAGGASRFSLDLERFPSNTDVLARRWLEHDVTSYNDGKFRLSAYDGMSKEAVIALEARHPPYVGDGGYDPGVIAAIYEPRRRGEIEQFLADEGGGAQLEPLAPPDCGAPYVSAEIAVPGLLEFYYARLLQRRRLVLASYPVVEGAGPEFFSLHTVWQPVKGILADASLKIEQKDLRISNFIEPQIRAFFVARRPDFAEAGEMTRLNGGTPFVYRLQVVGPRFTQCDRAGWEKLVLQIIPMPGIEADGSISFVFQFQEGFFAPGAPDRRPDDARFRENRLDDGALTELQGIMGRYLQQHGFVSDEGPADDASGTTQVACRLGGN